MLNDDGMCRRGFMGGLAFLSTHGRPWLVALLTLCLVAMFFEVAVEQRRWGLAALGSSLGGALLGGAAGWSVGGIGIAAMGGAVGLPALAVAALGALLAGSFLGTATVLAVLTSPGRYVVSWPVLGGLLVASSVVACLLVYRGPRLLGWLRSRWP